MTDMRDFGCVGNGCPKQDNCARYLDRENRDHIFTSAPFNHYKDSEGKAEFRCGWQEYPKKEEE